MSDDDLSSGSMVRIVCAAVRCKETDFIIPGVRHRDLVMREILDRLPFRQVLHTEDGFLTNQGEFLGRKEAWKVAQRADQIRNHPTQIPGELHSEDIY